MKKINHAVSINIDELFNRIINEEVEEETNDEEETKETLGIAPDREFVIIVDGVALPSDNIVYAALDAENYELTVKMIFSPYMDTFISRPKFD